MSGGSGAASTYPPGRRGHPRGGRHVEATPVEAPVERRRVRDENVLRKKVRAATMMQAAFRGRKERGKAAARGAAATTVGDFSSRLSSQLITAASVFVALAWAQAVLVQLASNAHSPGFLAVNAAAMTLLAYALMLVLARLRERFSPRALLLVRLTLQVLVGWMWRLVVGEADASIGRLHLAHLSEPDEMWARFGIVTGTRPASRWVRPSRRAAADDSRPAAAPRARRRLCPAPLAAAHAAAHRGAPPRAVPPRPERHLGLLHAAPRLGLARPRLCLAPRAGAPRAHASRTPRGFARPRSRSRCAASPPRPTCLPSPLPQQFHRATFPALPQANFSLAVVEHGLGADGSRDSEAEYTLAAACARAAFVSLVAGTLKAWAPFRHSARLAKPPKSGESFRASFRGRSMYAGANALLWVLAFAWFAVHESVAELVRPEVAGWGAVVVFGTASAFYALCALLLAWRGSATPKCLGAIAPLGALELLLYASVQIELGLALFGTCVALVSKVAADEAAGIFYWALGCAAIVATLAGIAASARRR